MREPQRHDAETDADANRALWLAVRRGLLAIVRAIEVRYNVGNDNNRIT